MATGIVTVLTTANLRAAVQAIWHIGPQALAGPDEVQIAIQGSLCRIDRSQALSILLDGDHGYSYEIFHPAKCYVRKNIDLLHANSPSLNSTNTPLPALTGRSSQIDGYKALEYSSVTPCGQLSWWVAPDYPDWRKVRELNAAADKLLGSALGASPLAVDLPGMVVRTESIIRAARSSSPEATNQTEFVTNISTLASCTIVPDDPSLGAIPPDYKEVSSLDSVTAPDQTVRFKPLDEIKGTAQRLASPDTSLLSSLANQMESRQALHGVIERSQPFPKDFQPPQGASSGAGSQKQASDNRKPGGFTLTVASWNDGKPQLQETVITNGPSFETILSTIHKRGPSILMTPPGIRAGPGLAPTNTVLQTVSTNRVRADTSLDSENAQKKTNQTSTKP